MSQSNGTFVTAQDELLKCVDCDTDFVFTVKEQQFYESKGLTNRPKRCQECRRKKRPHHNEDPAVKSQRMAGRVKWFDAAKGYGFIVPDGLAPGQNDVFVHFSAIRSSGEFRALSPDQAVEFELSNPASRRAENVVVIGGQ